MKFRLPEDSLIPAWVMKVGITGSVLWSFVLANLNRPGAVKLWLEGWEGILVYMSVGLGLSWAKDIMHRKVDIQASQAGGVEKTETIERTEKVGPQ